MLATNRTHPKENHSTECDTITYLLLLLDPIYQFIIALAAKKVPKFYVTLFK